MIVGNRRCPIDKHRGSSGRRGCVVTIYALGDPRSGEIRWVGQTVDPAMRLAHHCSGPGAPTQAWIRELKAAGLRPRMTLLERCAAEESRELERCYLETIEASGDRLLNVKWPLGRTGKRRPMPRWYPL